MKKIKLFMITLATGLMLFSLAPVTVFAAASFKDEIKGGAGLTDDGTNTVSVDNLLADIVNIASVVVGIAAVLAIFLGGFRYITSGGDSGKTSPAKNTIMYALIGLAIVALAQIIVKFVINNVQ